MLVASLPPKNPYTILEVGKWNISFELRGYKLTKQAAAREQGVAPTHAAHDHTAHVRTESSSRIYAPFRSSRLRHGLRASICTRADVVTPHFPNPSTLHSRNTCSDVCGFCHALSRRRVLGRGRVLARVAAGENATQRHATHLNGAGHAEGARIVRGSHVVAENARGAREERRQWRGEQRRRAHRHQGLRCW